MIKVCHMTSAHPAEDVRIFHKECVSLAGAGYEVYLVERGESYEKNGVHIVGVGEIPASRRKRMTQGARKVYRAALAIDADIYHFHDPELLPYGLKLKRVGKKVIFDSHEKYSEQIRNKPYLPRWCARIVSACYAAYEHYVLKRIDGLVFPCRMEGKQPFEGRCRHLATVNNLPRLEELYDLYDPSIPKYERSVVQIGSLTEARGITHLIEALRDVDCTAYLGGDFSSPSYREALEKLPGFTRVCYLGRLGREAVLDTLQHCRVGVATLLNVGQYYRSDNLSTKVYECMSLGLPVILNDSPYNLKTVERYHFGLCVNPAAPAEIASAIRRLLDHPEEARQMGENGRKAVKEEFNWGVEEKKLLALYEDILKE